MKIRQVERRDFGQWHRLRTALWPDATGPEEGVLMRDYLEEKGGTAFVAETGDGLLAGFVEASIRDVAEGCATRGVGYVEGWYVEEAHRRRGIGAALVKAAEAWARARGCREMASDCLVENEAGLAAHTALGYREGERLIHFSKPLG